MYGGFVLTVEKQCLLAHAVPVSQNATSQIHGLHMQKLHVCTDVMEQVQHSDSVGLFRINDKRHQWLQTGISSIIALLLLSHMDHVDAWIEIQCNLTMLYLNMGSTSSVSVLTFY